MINKYMPANPVSSSEPIDWPETGLTKHEYFTIKILAAIISKKGVTDGEIQTDLAVSISNYLLEALDYD